MCHHLPLLPALFYTITPPTYRLLHPFQPIIVSNVIAQKQGFSAKVRHFQFSRQPGRSPENDAKSENDSFFAIRM
jgi:hypothetical protein